MKKIHAYIAGNKERFLDELFELLRIPSVSLQREHKRDMRLAGDFIKSKILDAGTDNAELVETKGHPIIYGEKIIDPALPTVLVYGHYDVQPPDPLELWKSPPFEPVIRDGKIYARGASDNKGQLYMHIKAFEAMMRTDSLPCNIKFMFEGEEEMGSSSLGVFCRENREKLACDVILVSDTTMIAEDTPAITTGLRGLSYLEIEVTGPNRDLHSGLYGGAVANPINVLSNMLASLTDENNHITIPGFYDDVFELSDEERTEMAKAPFDLAEYKKSIGIEKEVGEKGYTSMERVGIRPSFDVNGIWGGYTEEGAKTVLPSKAYAKVSMRLVPDQSSEKTASLFEKHVKAIAPAGVNIKVRKYHGGEPYVSPIDAVAYQAASKAMEKTFGKKPVPVRSGGSIPIIPLFEEVLGVKSILMGFGLDTDAIHSPNEHFLVTSFYKGIETVPFFFASFAEMFDQQ